MRLDKASHSRIGDTKVDNVIRERETEPTPTLQVPHEDPATKVLYKGRVPKSLPFMFSGWKFSLYEPLWAQVS